MVRRVMVRYKVKPDRVAENEELVRAVYEELHQTDPSGIRYATFRADDGLAFIHIAFENDEDQFSLPDLPAFRRFTQDIRSRCDEAPVVTDLHEIGSFGLVPARVAAASGAGEDR
jgi:hypothetical protein